MLKDVHDAVRGLRTELDLSVGFRLGAPARGVPLRGLQAAAGRDRESPGQVRRVLRPRPAKETGPNATLDAGDVDEIEAKLVLAAACRNYAGELAVSEATRRVHSDLQNYFDSGTQVLIDRLRTSPPAERTFRQSQVDAAVRFCAKLFGADYRRHARQGRRRRRQGRAEGREGLTSAFSGLIFLIAALRGAVM